MQHKLRIAFFVHTVRSDWNNGNAHFLRGLIKNLQRLGHDVTTFEPETEWSLDNLRAEAEGQRSLHQFLEAYPELQITLYDSSSLEIIATWRDALRGFDLVVVHEWNPPELSHALLLLRDDLGYHLIFHDTHHRASSSPEQIRLFGVDQYDGVLAFGEVLRTIYQQRFGLSKVWTFHEAADTEVFRPIQATKIHDIVWIGNWADGERSAEIQRFVLEPAAALNQYRTMIYGVRYPEEGLSALSKAGAAYGGYLPNLEAPAVYAQSRVTVHVPRQQYSSAMSGIPTIRVFEALACGIPLISAPWADSERLFNPGDFACAGSPQEMIAAMEHLLTDQSSAADQAERGRRTVLERHTCAHRAQQFLQIAEEILG